MGVIWTEDQRTRQPSSLTKVNSSNAIANELGILMLRGEDTNYALGGPAATKTAAIPIVVGSSGLAGTLSSSAYFTFPANTKTNGPEYSVLTVIRPSGGGVFFDCGNFRIQLQNFFTDTSVQVDKAGAVQLIDARLGAGTIGTWLVFAVTYNATTGALTVSASNGVRASTTSAQTLTDGTSVLGNCSTVSNDVAMFAFAPTEWSSHQVNSLLVNPWQLFAPDSCVIPFDTAAGGSNITATLSSSLEAATLTGIGSVTRSGTLAVTLDAATVTGIGGVSLSGTLASTLADATLAGIGAVTTSGTLSVTLEDATLTGVGSVAVGTNRDGALAVTLDATTLAGIGAVTRSGTLAVTLDNATLAGIGTAGQAVTATLAVALDNATLSGIGAIPVAPSQGGGNGTGRNLSRKQKKKLKATESQEWLKAEETARQLLNDRFTKQTPQEKAEALQTYVESLQPVIEALKALTTQIEEVKEVVEDAPVMELTPHQEILSRFDTLEKKLKSVEELVIILMADL